MINEFRTFLMRGNVVDLAVAIVIGAAFGKIIDSLVKDIVMPPIGMILGKVDFSNLYINLSGPQYATLAEAQKAGAVTINYGLFVNHLVSFLIVAFTIFLVIRQINRRVDETAAPAERPCPFCALSIPLSATRCPHCTSAVTV